MNDRLKMLDVWVDPVTRETAIERATNFLRHGQRPHAIFASNPEKNFSVPANAELYRAFGEADLLIPDGIGMVWAAGVLYGAKLERVPGSEFIFDLSHHPQRSLYRYGVSFYKEGIDQWNQFVMHFLRFFDFTCFKGVYHGRHLGRHDIGSDGDDSSAAD